MTGQNWSTYSFTIPSWISSDWQFFVSARFFFATWLTFKWIKAKIVAKEGGVKWHKVETLLGGIVILHWKLPREERGWGNWPAILFRKPLSCTSGAFRIHLIYISRCSKLFFTNHQNLKLWNCLERRLRILFPKERTFGASLSKCWLPRWRPSPAYLPAALWLLPGNDGRRRFLCWGALDVFIREGMFCPEFPKKIIHFFGEPDFFGMSRRNFAISYPIFLSNSN